MAGLVIASAVLKEVLSTLKPLVLNEFWLLWGVKKEKDKLQSYLETIEAVLQDAERRQVKEMAVKNWLRKIKDAAHDAEDVLDKFRIEALRRKVENQAAGMRKKVGKLFYPPVFRFKMAHKMQKLRKNFEHIAKERSLFSFTEGVVDSQPRISRARETCSKIVSEVYGRDTEKAKLIDLLIKPESENKEDLSVIPIVGMGGLGKTTLARLVYHDKQVVTHFKLRMWVYVSENFDVGMLLKEILQSAIDGPTAQLSMELLQTRLQKELSGKRYLLVLDDVWNENSDEWDRLKALLKSGANGSKILVTTRHDAVAKIMHAVPRPRLGILSNKKSWNLFQKLANPPPMCVAIGQEMVEKCRGLPLAIRTIGGLMSSKETVSEWESVRDSSNLWKPQDSDGGILPILQLSYDHLTPSLKQCFAFCAVFPKGYSFFKQKLIKQWIALGFIHSDEENELLEEKAEGYFNQLLQRSLFQGPYYLKEEYYKMHDLIHDLVRFVGEKECFIVKASMDTVPKEARHLTVQDDKWAREPENLEALKQCKKLRSIVTPPFRFCSADINACLSLTGLRVLDLRYTDSSYLPNSIDKLKHLRYLDVSGTSIKELPETICNLHSLQTLRINYTRIRMLPKNMKRMISLRHFELDEYQCHILLPKGIGELTCLRTLSTFVVGDQESRAGIEELKGLNQLCRDFCIRGLNHVRNGECAREANLKAKKHLHSLKLSWDGTAADTEENSEEVIENLEPHSRLKKLAVEKYMGMKFPNWMKMHTNLTDIKLSFCIRCEHLPPLWRLPFLESLELRSMSAVKYIVDFDGRDNSKYIFPCLKHLELHEMFDLEGWSSQREDGDGDGDGDEQRRERDEQVILQALRTLNISQCPKLIRIPSLHHVSSLTSIKISEVGCNVIEIPASQSLTELSLSDMPNLERLSVQEADDDDDGGQMIFGSLFELKIDTCPKLICMPQLLLPALEMFDMSRVCCHKIEFSTSHSLQSVRLFYVPNFERLSLQASNDNEHVVFFPSIKFSVSGCPRMTLLLHLLPSSISSSKSESKNLEYISAHMLQNLTASLVITGCPKLRSSIVSLKNLKPIESLTITGCPDMKKLVGSLENFTSLTFLSIVACHGKWSLPKSVKNLKSLNELCIGDCPGISSLPESMGDLTLLTRLVIWRCPGITALPNGLKRLANLYELRIYGCPVLKRKLRFPKGQDWHKVAHVPKISIDSLDPRSFIHRSR